MTEAGTATAHLSHSKTRLVNRDQLRALPEVISTDSFKPVAHIELVDTITEELLRRDIQIVSEQLAISKDGMKLFGTFNLTKNGIEGMSGALGIRQANNRTMSLSGVAGMHVFVCDNMAMSGETIVLKRRHTSGLVLLDEVVEALNEYERHYARLKTEVLSLQGYPMQDAQAKILMHDIFAQRIMPVRYLPDVSDVYFHQFTTSPEPKFAAFSDRTAWSLLNAFTEVQKDMPLTTRMDAAQEVGGIFGKLLR